MASLVAAARLWTANHRPAAMRLPAMRPSAMHLPAVRPAAMRPKAAAWLARRTIVYSAKDRAVFDKYGVQPDETANIPPSILDKIGRNLHNQPHHPIQMAKRLVVDSLNRSCERRGRPPFRLFDALPPFVTVKQNFDDLLIPAGHVSRQATDTYYASRTHLLRTHTSAHQTDLMRQGHRSFLVAADVYRRDEIDSTHYPVFHQMEGVRFFSTTEGPMADAVARAAGTAPTPPPPMIAPAAIPLGEQQTGPLPGLEAYQPAHLAAAAQFVVDDLKVTLEDLARDLFGNDVEMRWVDGFFPFTRPSLELEVHYQGRWMELLGSGVVQQRIAHECGIADQIGWAFGIGLERLAMRLYDIPDIRLFWSEDRRFLDQFNDRKPRVTFVPYSKYPPCYKDVAFWLPDATGGAVEFHDNNFYEVVRGVAGDLVENVALLRPDGAARQIDQFTHPKTGQRSRCYRIMYRSMDRSLTNQEINTLQDQVRQELVAHLGVRLR